MTPKQKRELQLISKGEPPMYRGVRNALAKMGLAFRRKGEWKLTWTGAGELIKLVEKEKSPSD